MNKQSNRAHRIFTFLLQFKRGDVWLTSTLSLVDLAGSEDINRSGATGVAAKEVRQPRRKALCRGEQRQHIAHQTPPLRCAG